ncbi:MAG: redox-sensing transcriptional repressor Rex [Spirochaetales bacterium]
MKRSRTVDREATSKPTTLRLPAYLQIVRQAEKDGVLVISGTTIAEELILEPIQVRKDLAVTGIVGKPRVGYVVKDLIAALERFLRWDQTNPAIIIGCGNLGTALLGYAEFRMNGLNIVAAFDNDPVKVGKKYHGIKVRDIDELTPFLGKNPVTIAILSVPPHEAQEICTKVLLAGVKKVLNFASVKLRVPDGIKGVLIHNEDMSTGYAYLMVDPKVKWKKAR